MVSTEILAAICVDSGISKWFQHRSPALGQAIQIYTKAVRMARDAEHAAAAREKRRLKPYWIGLSPPKVREVIELYDSAYIETHNECPAHTSSTFQYL